jgi:hypothetical protein
MYRIIDAKDTKKMRNTKTKSEKSKWEVAEKETGPQRKSPYGPSFYTHKNSF